MALCMTPGVNCNVKNGLWVIMLYQHRFIICNKCTTLIGYVDNGGSYSCVYMRTYGKSPPFA